MTSPGQPAAGEAGSRRVVDTNVISYVLKGDTRGPLYRPHLHTFRLAVSFQTVAELQAFLNPLVVIHSDQRLCQQNAQVIHASRSAGTNIGAADAWIAATALALRCPPVTHDVAGLAGVPNLQIISERTA